MIHLANMLALILDIYFYIIIASVVISWLVAFDIVNIRHPKAAKVVELLNKATEPVYKPIRKVLPPIGGIDLSPIVVIIGIALVKDLIYKILT